MIPLQWHIDTMEWILGYDYGFPVYVSIAKECEHVDARCAILIFFKMYLIPYQDGNVLS